MSTIRPKPRTSSLAGQSAVTPLGSAPDEAVPVAAAQPAPVDDAPAAPAAKSAYRKKLGYYPKSDADANRVRAAIRHTGVQEGYRGLTDFMEKVIMAEVERLEQRYNGGKPFPGGEAGELPAGRPMGE